MRRRSRSISSTAARVGRRPGNRQDDDHVDLGRATPERTPGPVLDIGCGPGWNLLPTSRPTPDRSRRHGGHARSRVARSRVPGTRPRVRRSVPSRLPVGRGLPRWGRWPIGSTSILRHWSRCPWPWPTSIGPGPDAPAFVRAPGPPGRAVELRGDHTGGLRRPAVLGLAARPSSSRSASAPGSPSSTPTSAEPTPITITLEPSGSGCVGPRHPGRHRRAGMRLLICGLNPSPTAVGQPGSPSPGRATGSGPRPAGRRPRRGRP